MDKRQGKDWCLAFLFAALMGYVAVVRFFQWKVLDFRQKFMPDKMSTMNLPGGYGTVLFWALIMALLVMAVLALRRQKRKYIAAAGLAGFLIADCALGGFVYHCRLIVQRGTEVVSYTHLDVYKRQMIRCSAHGSSRPFRA